MVKAITAILMLALAVFAADQPRGQVGPEQAAQLGEVCKHYVNRARFKPRHDQQDFVVTLADGCRAAEVSLASQKFAERQAAAVFLARLKTLRDLVIDMNMTRVFGADYTPVTRIPYLADARSEPVRKVSEAGEYLIAHRLGLLQVYQAWLDTSPQVALVSDEDRNRP